MLAAVALAALLVGGIQTAVIVSDSDRPSAQDARTALVDTQSVQGVDE
jgi:hypothetical protein